MIAAASLLESPSGIGVRKSTYATAYSQNVPSKSFPCDLNAGQSYIRVVRKATRPMETDTHGVQALSSSSRS